MDNLKTDLQVQHSFQPKTIGKVIWTHEDMMNSLPEFRSLYQSRPFDSNDGGMKAPHMFLTWFLLRQLNPETIIESGVFKGYGTWLIEQACPNAQIKCLDPNLDQIEFKGKNASYSSQDFESLDARDCDPEKTLCFFDDHQNSYKRLQLMKWFGLKYAIFEDNYPPGQGDCYSLKKILMKSGHFYAKKASGVKEYIRDRIGHFLGFQNTEISILPREADYHYLLENLKVYWEGPPLFKLAHTRWGDNWDEEKYPTQEPLLADNPQDDLYSEADAYTWLCYVELNTK